MALDFIAGCVGGSLGVLVGHPFDTIKVRIQTQDAKNPKYKGTFHCMTSIIRSESARGLYKGMSSPIAGVSAVNAILFGVYGNVQRNLPNPESLVSVCIAGTIGGIVQSVICCPVELIKTRLQLQNDGNSVRIASNQRTGKGYIPSDSMRKYRGPLDCFRKIRAAEGWRGIYRGFSVTVVREAPAFGMYFVSYEVLSREFQAAGFGLTFSVLCAGGLSGIVSWILCYPVDVVKSRVQADGAMGTPRRYKGAWNCAQVSYQTEGWRVFLRGINSTLIRAFPTNAATFVGVSWTLKLLTGQVHMPERIVEPVLQLEDVAIAQLARSEILGLVL